MNIVTRYPQSWYVRYRGKDHIYTSNGRGRIFLLCTEEKITHFQWHGAEINSSYCYRLYNSDVLIVGDTVPFRVDKTFSFCEQCLAILIMEELAI